MRELSPPTVPVCCIRQALRALNSLTEGKRLIGIISHVGELRRAIDRQIVATRDRAGGSSVKII